MRIISNRDTDGRVYNLPSVGEVAALIPGDFDDNLDKRDIVLQIKSGKLRIIHECHVSYLSLQYPLLFPKGEDGYRLGIKKTETNTSKRKKKQKDVSMRQWFDYRLQERKDEKHILLRSKRLLQQFIVDAFTMIESNRLRFIKKNQRNCAVPTSRQFKMLLMLEILIFLIKEKVLLFLHLSPVVQLICSRTT